MTTQEFEESCTSLVEKAKDVVKGCTRLYEGRTARAERTSAKLWQSGVQKVLQQCKELHLQQTQMTTAREKEGSDYRMKLEVLNQTILALQQSSLAEENISANLQGLADYFAGLLIGDLGEESIESLRSQVVSVKNALLEQLLETSGSLTTSKNQEIELLQASKDERTALGGTISKLSGSNDSLANKITALEQKIGTMTTQLGEHPANLHTLQTVTEKNYELESSSSRLKRQLKKGVGWLDIYEEAVAQLLAGVTTDGTLNRRRLMQGADLDSVESDLQESPNREDIFRGELEALSTLPAELTKMTGRNAELLARSQELQTTLDGILVEKKDLETRVTALQGQQSELQIELEAMKHENTRVSAEAQQQNELRIQDVARAEREKALAKGEVARVDQEKELLLRDVTRLGEEKVQAERDVTRVNQEKALLLRDVTRLGEEKAQARRDVTRVESEKTKLRDEVTRLGEERTKLKEEVTRVEREKALLGQDVTRLEGRETQLEEELCQATSAKTSLEEQAQRLQGTEQTLRSTLSELPSLEDYRKLKEKLATMVEGNAFRGQEKRISELEAELRSKLDNATGAELQEKCNKAEAELATLRARFQYQTPQTPHTQTISEASQESLSSGSGSMQPDPFTGFRGLDALNPTPELRLQHLLSKQNEVLADFVLADGTDSTIACKQISRIMAEQRSTSNIPNYIKQAKKKGPQWQCLLEIAKRGTKSAVPVADDQQCEDCARGENRWCVQTKWEKDQLLVRTIGRSAAVATETEELGSKRQRTR